MFISSRVLAYLASMGLFFSLVGCTDDSTNRTSPRSKGIKDAEALIATGTLQMKEYPALPYSAQEMEYLRLLREKCGVSNTVPNLPAGVSEKDFREEVEGWNSAMRSAIQQKFGADIFAKLHEEADNLWQERVKAVKKDE